MIKPYLKDARFLHVSRMLGCTITLKDVHLQLGLSVDGLAGISGHWRLEWHLRATIRQGVRQDYPKSSKIFGYCQINNRKRSLNERHTPIQEFNNASRPNSWSIPISGTSSSLCKLFCRHPKTSKHCTMVDLQWRTDEDWPKFHNECINIWEHRYNFILIRKPIITRELTTTLKYMSWFRHHDKPYLLLKEERGRQSRTRKCRDGIIINSNPTRGTNGCTTS
ncbi:hypothetical protein Golax_021757, partial [Gossypium laxum]|nr:hypothetical protein [Gossypium laxum]